MKSMNWISQTGRMPMYDAPIAEPTIAASEMGVSMTRCLAELLLQPFGDLEGSAVDADVFTHDEDPLVGGHLFEERLTNCFEI